MAQDLFAIALKTGLLMCAAGIACLTLARSSAAARHLVWVSALALALLLPLTSAVMPSYAVIEVPWAPVEAATIAQPSAASGWSVWHGLLVVWVTGALLLLLRDMLAHAVLTRFGRRAQTLSSPGWIAALKALEGPAAMRVLESDRVAGPCTWGLLKPILVLPRSAESWSDTERRYALTHELAHIQRRDYMSAAITRLACAMHWYNPLVWYAARQALKLQEQACDDAVLRAGAVPSDYAQLLVGIARTCSGSPRSAMGMAERSPLYHRVRAILDPHKVRTEQSRSRALATILPLACAMALVAGAGLAEPDAEPGTEPTIIALQQRSVAPIANAKPMRGVRMRHIRATPSALRQADPATPAVVASEPMQALAPMRPVPPIPPVPPVPPTQPVPPIPPLPPTPE